MTKLRCVPVEPTEAMEQAGIAAWDEDGSSTRLIIKRAIAAAPPPPAEIEEALELAKEFLDDPDARAQVKVLLAMNGYPLVADMIDEAVTVSRAILQSLGRE